ncbi:MULTISPECIES: hypothetical protein [unclassified Nocardia]|uniref:hypothetical protein n=1 Tax=unclassified Nocardia TaxID=2637762 RepID=UPI00278C4B54|nr:MULTISPECIES: hypothetical protein [unclassified Nocardia]
MTFTGGGRIPFLPSRMTKNGDWGTLGTSFYPVESWTADTVGYPGSSLSGHGLVVQGSNAAAAIRFDALVYNGNTSYVDCTLRLLVNATPVATGTPQSIDPFGGTTTATVTITTAVNAGDAITVEAKANVSGWLTIKTGTGTFVRIT